MMSFVDIKGGGYSNGANDDDLGKMCFNAAKVSQKEIVITLSALWFH
jgi:hypothetical protein